MARKKKYVPKAFESGKAGDVSANIYASMMQSKAWNNLTNNAKVLYLYMKLQYYGQKTIPDREQECLRNNNNCKPEGILKRLWCTSRFEPSMT